MTDYWLSKLFYDLQEPAAAAAFKAAPESVVGRYKLAPEIARAVLADDVAALAPHVNPYLLRYYFGCRGLSDRDFIDQLQKTEAAAPARREGESHG